MAAESARQSAQGTRNSTSPLPLLVLLFSYETERKTFNDEDDALKSLKVVMRDYSLNRMNLCWVDSVVLKQTTV